MTRWIALALLTACNLQSPPPIPKEPVVLQTKVNVEDVKGCNRCAMDTRVHVRDNPGVKQVHIDIATGDVTVTHFEDQLTAVVLKQSLEDQGHKVTVVSSEPYVEPVEPEVPAAEGKDESGEAASEGTTEGEPAPDEGVALE